MFKTVTISFFCIMAMAIPAVVSGQNALQDFENGVSAFNKLRAFADSMEPGQITGADMLNADTLYQNSAQAFAKTAAGAVDSLHFSAGYFKTNAAYQYARILIQNGNKSQALAILQGAEKGFDAFVSDSFPLEYNGLQKYFIVHWSDFVQDQCMYNAALGALYYENGVSDKALDRLRKSSEAGCLELDAQALQSNQILKIKSDAGGKDEEMLSTALGLFETWNNLDETTRNGLPALKDVPTRCTAIIEEILAENPEFSDEGEVWARVSRLLADEREESKAVTFAVNAIKAGYKDKEFMLAVFPMAERVGDRAAARLAADEFASQVESYECDNLSLAAQQYETLKEELLSSQYRNRANACEKSKAKQAKVVARDGGLYLGTYVQPWFRTDWGAVAAIQTRKHMFEFSYQALDDRRDKLYDLRMRDVNGAADQKARWDGYYAHVAINRIRGKKGAKGYTGTLWGYNLREFQTMSVANITDKNGISVNDGKEIKFNPREERYILMMNAGTHSYGRVLASSFFVSLGGAWSTFDRGNALYDNDDYIYVDNPLLNSRKSGRFSLMARVGVTIGLQFGPRMMEKKEKKKGHS